MKFVERIECMSVNATVVTSISNYQCGHRELGNLMLRNSVPIKTILFITFRLILETLNVEWQNSTLRFVLLANRVYRAIVYILGISPR